MNRHALHITLHQAWISPVRSSWSGTTSIAECATTHFLMWGSIR
jgi:hypothetical protein